MIYNSENNLNKEDFDIFKEYVNNIGIKVTQYYVLSIGVFLTYITLFSALSYLILINIQNAFALFVILLMIPISLAPVLIFIPIIEYSFLGFSTKNRDLIIAFSELFNISNCQLLWFVQHDLIEKELMIYGRNLVEHRIYVGDSEINRKRRIIINEMKKIIHETRNN